MRHLLLAMLLIACGAQAQTLVLSCADAGADGRVLESATINWPNCQSADLRPAARTLVVATNGGAYPFLWKLGSSVTTQKIWSQDAAGVENWRLASDIAWGTTPVPPVTSIGSATLNWTPPTQNTDGTSLTNLAGFRVAYGASTTALNQTVDVPGAGVRKYTIGQLADGTWYFAVKAYTSIGTESALSNVVSKTVSSTSVPVDCAVSPWSAWVVGPWSACANGQRSHTDVHTRVVTTQPSNGGAACPALTESQTITEPCVPVLVTIGGDVLIASPDYANWDRWKTGAKAGTVTPAQKCELARPIKGTNLYRVSTGITWTGAKKTYAVAACKLQ